jgi:hypothetical protein
VLRNALVPVTITAKDINDATITNYNQSVGFGAADVNTVTIPVTPTGGSDSSTEFFQRMFDSVRMEPAWFSPRLIRAATWAQVTAST